MSARIDIVRDSPDTAASGLTTAAIDALRYDGHTDDPHEVAGIIRAMMPPGVRVLDVGCGTGSVTLIANAGHDNRVVAVEPDADRAAVAESRGIAVHNRLLDDAFIAEHGRFDVVMSSDVMEHVAAPAEFLGMMMRAAVPGGVLIVSVPNVAHWSVRLNLLAGRFDYEPTGIMDATHLRWFTARSIRALVEAAGLELIELRQTAGVDLATYHRGPLRRLPRGLVNPAVRQATRWLPRLFGVQHVVKARVPG